MKRRHALVAVLLLFAAPVYAQDSGNDVAGTLFSDILNGVKLSFVPFLPPLTLSHGLTVHLLMLIISAALIFVLFSVAFRKPMAKPKGLAMALEIIVLFVRNDIVYPVMGKQRGDKWLPFFTTQFIFLLTVNFLGLVPAFRTATGNITVTSAFAIIVLLLVFVVGIGHIGFRAFFRNLFPEGVVLPLGLFVAALEFIGLFIKSLVLSLRLFANMFAGHLAILSFLVLMMVLNPLFGLVSVPFALFTYALEVLVALIQALVFTILSCVFINMASSVHNEAAEKRQIEE